MQLFDPNNPNEKKKMIAAAVLFLAAVLVLGYLLLGGSGSTKPPIRVAASPTPTPPRGGNEGQTTDLTSDDLLLEVHYSGTFVGAPEADRNIFAYYVAPTPLPRPSPPPSPTPTPPLVVSAVSPASVYARTGDFSLQVGGDKFTPAVRIIIDGRAMATRFISAQQVATTVTADLIANPGNRRVEVRSPDGTLFSNTMNFNVTAPPVPNFNYVGLIGKPRGNDIAVLQDKNSKDLFNFQRGEVVGGRFRLTSISAKEVVLIDTNLNIPHKITFTAESSTGGRPPVRRPVVDDDP